MNECEVDLSRAALEAALRDVLGPEFDETAQDCEIVTAQRLEQILLDPEKAEALAQALERHSFSRGATSEWPVNPGALKMTESVGCLDNLIDDLPSGSGEHESLLSGIVAASKWDNLGKFLQLPFYRNLLSLGMPSKKDIDSLDKRIAELTAQIQKISDAHVAEVVEWAAQIQKIKDAHMAERTAVAKMISATAHVHKQVTRSATRTKAAHATAQAAAPKAAPARKAATVRKPVGKRYAA